MCVDNCLFQPTCLTGLDSRSLQGVLGNMDRQQLMDLLNQGSPFSVPQGLSGSSSSRPGTTSGDGWGQSRPDTSSSSATSQSQSSSTVPGQSASTGGHTSATRRSGANRDTSGASQQQQQQQPRLAIYVLFHCENVMVQSIAWCVCQVCARYVCLVCVPGVCARCVCQVCVPGVCARCASYGSTLHSKPLLVHVSCRMNSLLVGVDQLCGCSCGHHKTHYVH